MDRALWLLLRLRLAGWLRRWARDLGSPRRLLLFLIALLCFAPGPLFVLLAPRVQVDAQVALVRRFGPAALLLLAMLNLLISPEDRALSYAPAEVDFLFPGPFRRRQLLLYRIVGTLLSAVLSAFFFTCLAAHHSYSFGSAFLGVLLAFEMLYLLTLAAGLLASTIGAMASDWRRRAVLAGAGLILAAGLAESSRGFDRAHPVEALQRLERSGAVQIAEAPFRPFVLAFTAARAWPDLALWSAISAAIDLGLLGLILGLDALSLEAAAGASARRYERLQRARRGGGLADSSEVRWRLPMLPWWGGVGPNLWRQGTTALRSPSRLGAVWFLFLLPVVVSTLLPSPTKSPDLRALFPMTMIGTFTLISSTMIGFDFRPDLDRMEGLKTLPIRPTRLVLSQLLAPAAVLTIGHLLAIGLLAALLPVPAPLLVGAALLLPPFNLLLVAVEDLYFLWFPVRLASGQSVDFQAMGRQLLLMMAKMVTAGLAASVAAGLAALAYYLSGGSWPATIGAAWLVVSASAAGLVPLVALAFEQFDVARDTPA